MLKIGDRVVYLGFIGNGTGTSVTRENLKVNNIYTIVDVDELGFVRITEHPEQWLLADPRFQLEYHNFENLKQNRKRKLKRLGKCIS